MGWDQAKLTFLLELMLIEIPLSPLILMSPVPLFPLTLQTCEHGVQSGLHSWLHDQIDS